MNDTRRDLVDRLLPEGLETFLRSARENGESYFTISVRLRDEHGISVNPASLRRWAINLGITDPDRTEPEAASA